MDIYIYIYIYMYMNKLIHAVGSNMQALPPQRG